VRFKLVATYRAEKHARLLHLERLDRVALDPGRVNQRGDVSGPPRLTATWRLTFGAVGTLDRRLPAAGLAGGGCGPHRPGAHEQRTNDPSGPAAHG
jgi:hypothetical protein